ncbi:MAG: LysR family transcriptional regulator [Pseudomonadota bacterium]
MQDLSWDDLRLLLVLARSGRLSLAARQLGVDETTVGRRLTRCEERLAGPLFARAGGRLEPTPRALPLIEAAARMEVESLSAQAATGRVGGRLRLTAVPLVANRLLIPALPDLLAQHAGLELEIIAEPSQLSVLRGEVDLALRFAKPDAEARALTRRLADLPFAPYCLADQDPTKAPWITYEPAMQALPQAQWMAARLKGSDERAAQISVHDGETLVQALKAGLGRSLLPCAVGDALAHLKRCGPVSLRRPLWVLLHPLRKDLPALRLVLDWLTQAVKPWERAPDDPA